MYFEVCCLTFRPVKALTFMKAYLPFPTLSVFLYLSLQTYLEVFWRNSTATTLGFWHFANAFFEALDSLNYSAFNPKPSELHQSSIKMVTTSYIARSPSEWKWQISRYNTMRKKHLLLRMLPDHISQCWSQAEFGCLTSFCKASGPMLLVNWAGGLTTLAFPYTSLSPRAGSAVPN